MMKFIITALLLLVSTPSWADAIPNNVSTIGRVLSSISGDLWGPVILLFWSGSMLVGVFLIITGILKMVPESGREGIPLKEVALRLGGGGMLVSLWDTIQMGPATMFDSASTAFGWSWKMENPGNVKDCLSLEGGVTCMASNFASNVVPVALSFIWMAAFVAGVWFIITAIQIMATKNERSGGSQSKPLPRIIIGFILCQLPLFIGSISTTFGYANPVIMGNGMLGTDTSMLSYTSPVDFGLLTNYSELLGKLFIIMVLFGVMNIWKGIRLINTEVDGGSKNGMGAGVTHIIGGVMLANMKASTCFILNTLIGAGLNFCTN